MTVFLALKTPKDPFNSYKPNEEHDMVLNIQAI